MPVTSAPITPGTITPSITPGSATTEYKLTLVTAILGAVLSVGAALHPGFHLDEGAQAAIVSAGVALVGWVSAWYTHSRTKIKTAALTGQSS